MPKKLPIGIQTLSHIIEGGYVYVDKTPYAFRMIDQGKYYFLSRPRRFGKSLFLDTLKEIFEGNKALFEGLYIEDKWDFEDRYPVIHISLGAGMSVTKERMYDMLRWQMSKEAKRLGVEFEETAMPRDILARLIWSAREKYGKPVVVLIDEYDKPILDNITNTELAREMRDELKDMYTVIKASDELIQLVFITGVSKFSKLNLFSGLNNLNDITLNPTYGNICGYSHEEVLEHFQEHLAGVNMEEVRAWYNGYNYFGDKVYNPFDILLFIDNELDFRNYWWSTGNPTFLIDLVKSKAYDIPNVENYEATDSMLDSFDVDNIELEPLLWQTGYLTIKEKFTFRGRNRYRLGVPNKEIQYSLNDFFIDVLTTQKTQKSQYQDGIYTALVEADMEKLKAQLKALFASIPYQNFTNNRIAEYEGYYASVVYAYLASLGFDIIPEDTTNQGQLDLTLKTGQQLYLFEFKVVDSPSGQALQQLKSKNYAQKYQPTGSGFYVGIEFSKAERNVVGFEWEEFI